VLAVFKMPANSQTLPSLKFRCDIVTCDFGLQAQRVANEIQVGLTVMVWNKKLVSETSQRVVLVKFSGLVEQHRFRGIEWQNKRECEVVVVSAKHQRLTKLHYSGNPQLAWACQSLSGLGILACRIELKISSTCFKAKSKNIKPS